MKSVSQAISCTQTVTVWKEQPHLNLVTLEGSLVRVQDSLDGRYFPDCMF